MIEVIAFIIGWLGFFFGIATYPAYTPFDYDLNESWKYRRIMSNQYWVRDNIGWTMQAPNTIGWEITEKYQDDPTHDYYRLEIEDQRGTKKERLMRLRKHMIGI